MERLKKISRTKASLIKTDFKRFLFNEIDWEQPLSLILGHRGVGKTTMLLQRMKQLEDKAIYLSLDDISFETNRLINLIDSFYDEGIKYLFLDEIHRYQHWSKDLKNAYDNYPDLKIAATGSSILEIHKGQADLSRRAVSYHLPGLSFREFLELEYQQFFSALDLTTILHSHHQISGDYTDKLDVGKAYKEYLQYGYYPFYKDGIKTYGLKLQETTNLVLEIDIAPFEDLSHTTVRNMKKLLYVISQSVPFTPNISKISEHLSVPRNTILKILDLLAHAKVLSLLKQETKGMSYLQKPEKVYLQNTNLAYRLSDNQPNIGNIRETFFLSQVEVRHHISSSRTNDFMVDNSYTFEIGGPNKTAEQLRGIPNAFIAADDITGGTGNKIPLWLFGFLY